MKTLSCYNFYCLFIQSITLRFSFQFNVITCVYRCKSAVEILKSIDLPINNNPTQPNRPICHANYLPAYKHTWMTVGVCMCGKVSVFLLLEFTFSTDGLQWGVWWTFYYLNFCFICDLFECVGFFFGF